ncbi:MAG: glutamine amidotransferase [Kiritimatiellae bacterium]|nr:glutamine amidotransferase [Kiritimatiellia bacterium]
MRTLFILFIMLGLFTGILYAAPVQVSEESSGGQKRILMKSDMLELIVAPEHGGQIVSMIHRKTRTQMGNTGSTDKGLFSEHDMKQHHPGELMQALFDARVEPVAGDGSGSVTLTCTAKGGWRNETPPSLKDVRFEKTYILYPDIPIIHLKVNIQNKSDEDKLIDYWVQSIARIGDSNERNYYFRPSPEGLSVVSSDFSVRDAYVQQPYAGWSGVLNVHRRLGMVYLVDYQALRRLYNCQSAYTQEFMYQRIPVPVQRSWETELKLRVVEGFDGFCHASERLVADVQVALHKERLTVTHTMCAFERPLTNVRIMTAVQDVASRIEQSTTPIAIARVGSEAVSRQVDFDLPAGGMKVVVVTVSSDAGTDRYERPFSFFGDISGTYYRTPPPRRLNLMKPENLAEVWSKSRAETKKVYQLGDDYFAFLWGFDAVAKACGMHRTLGRYFPGCDWRDALFNPFPTSYGELFRYDVVILANADAMALGQYGCEMIKDFILQGGGLLILGGLNSFGKGTINDMPIADVCPVTCQGLWDLRKAANPLPCVATNAFPFLETLSWKDNPAVDWYQEVTVKEKAQVHLTLDNRPLLVTAAYGRGRVAVFAGTILGDAQECRARGGVPLWEWSGYLPMMTGITDWLRQK